MEMVTQQLTSTFFSVYKTIVVVCTIARQKYDTTTNATRFKFIGGYATVVTINVWAEFFPFVLGIGRKNSKPSTTISWKLYIETVVS